MSVDRDAESRREFEQYQINVKRQFADSLIRGADSKYICEPFERDWLIWLASEARWQKEREELRRTLGKCTREIRALMAATIKTREVSHPWRKTLDETIAEAERHLGK
jgi:hypothetical protein